MNPILKNFRPPALVGAVAVRTNFRAPRFPYGLKLGQPIGTSNRAFIWDWVSRRPKLISSQPRLLR